MNGVWEFLYLYFDANVHAAKKGKKLPSSWWNKWKTNDKLFDTTLFVFIYEH